MSKVIALALMVAVVWFLFSRNSNNKELAQENIKQGQVFLASNKLEDDVQETMSGLQYKVLTRGTGEQHPSARDKVEVHYHGTLLDGTVFDSSVDRGEPLSFGLNQVIPGWTEGVQLMVVGEKTRFFIPSHLGYGNRAAGKIMPGSTLIFDVELLAIK